MKAEFKVKNVKLAAPGKKKIDWARAHMPVLAEIKKHFSKQKPLKGIRIAACLHVTKETAVLMEVLKSGGASVALCGSNPLSTQDDVAAALARNGVSVFAWRGITQKEYYWCVNRVLDFHPHITLDDGADLISTVHAKRTELISGIIGGQEETTTGVIRLKAMAKDGALRYPVVAVNDTPTKRLLDNIRGTGQSTIDGIIRATNILLAGKTFVVAGYGHCGRGLAERARGMGANVVVTEVDAMKALEASMAGFRVMPMKDAARIGDVFVTATGDINVIDERHFSLLKDGAILANTGHFDVEINVKQLEKMAKKKSTILPEVEEYTLANGKRVILLAQGRLVNLACAEGHPPAVMDTSFANQALVSEWLVRNKGKITVKVHEVPKEIDYRVAQLKLSSYGLRIDKLTPEQEKYLASWQEGT
ncbi:MAG: adenosylhomocysteinase [Candidatus Norongarragalinales archaeon]